MHKYMWNKSLFFFINDLMWWYRLLADSSKMCWIFVYSFSTTPVRLILNTRGFHTRNKQNNIRGWDISVMGFWFNFFFLKNSSDAISGVNRVKNQVNADKLKNSFWHRWNRKGEGRIGLPSRERSMASYINQTITSLQRLSML